MPNIHLTSFKIGDKEFVDLPNLNLDNVEYEVIDEEEYIIELLNPAVVYASEGAVIQIIVKPEHRNSSLYKVLTVRDGDNNARELLKLYHNEVTNNFGTNFENDGILTVNTSRFPVNEMYSVELQLFRSNPENPTGPPIELVFYYLEVFLGNEPTPEPTPTPTPAIQDLESELFIKIAGQWFRLVDKVN